MLPGQIWVTGDADPKAEGLLRELGSTETKSRVDERLNAQKECHTRPE